MIMVLVRSVIMVAVVTVVMVAATAGGGRDYRPFFYRPFPTASGASRFGTRSARQVVARDAPQYLLCIDIELEQRFRVHRFRKVVKHRLECPQLEQFGQTGLGRVGESSRGGRAIRIERHCKNLRQRVELDQRSVNKFQVPLHLLGERFAAGVALFVPILRLLRFLQPKSLPCVALGTLLNQLWCVFAQSTARNQELCDSVVAFTNRILRRGASISVHRVEVDV